MSAAAVDPLWVAFGVFGFGCTVVAFTIGCWVGRGAGQLEAPHDPEATRRPGSLIRRAHGSRPSGASGVPRIRDRGGRA